MVMHESVDMTPEGWHINRIYVMSHPSGVSFSVCGYSRG